MKINEWFDAEYLISGNTADNSVFENCSTDFLCVDVNNFIAPDLEK